MSGRVENQRWRPLTGSTWQITHSSVCKTYTVSNDISTAMSMFTEFSDASVLLLLLLPVNGRHLWLTTCPDIGQYSQWLSVLPDHGNMGVSVGMSLLSCIRVVIYVFSYLLPVNGRHLWYTTYPNIEQHHNFYSVFYGPENVLLPLRLCCYIMYIKFWYV